MKNIVRPLEAYRHACASGMCFDASMMCTEHFSWRELFRGQKELAGPDVFDNLYRVARVLQTYRNGVLGNRPITVTSGWRSAEYNRKIGGAANSYHVKGMAVDIVCEGLSPQAVQNRLDPIHTGGLEWASSWTHIDTRPYRARFKEG